ncbi:MAG: ATP synthase F0 subunit B [Acidobacteria bacterium]|nr:ATP synthase F0 subunit B [Acidobacteriota bacterium]
MTNLAQLRSSALFLPALFADHQPLLLSGGFWTSPSGFPKLVNLVLFIVVLYLLLRKPAREFFAERLATVRTTLERAAKEKAAATAKIAELDARLNRLDAELAEIKTQAQTEAQAERARLDAEAQRDAEKLRTMAQREIETAKQVALSDLREFAASKSVDLAEQIIRQELKPEDDAKMLQRMADEMSKVS